MKFKPLNKEENILELARFNKNVEGKHISASHGVGSQDKRNFAALCLLGIMSQTKEFDEVVKNDKDARLKDIIIKLTNSASLIIDKTFLKDDGKKVL